MANYKINIIKTEPNPEYKEQMAEYIKNEHIFYRNISTGRVQSSFNRDNGAPQAEFVKDVLICELTEDQYKKVKGEVFKVFE